MTTSADGLPSNYRFADLTLDVARRCVLRQGRPVELKALDFDLLRFLVESAPNVVNADVLAEKVWGRHFVSPENVAQRVMLLRQSLADDANRPRYIETVRNKGYRLIPVVERAPAEEAGRVPRRRGLMMTAAALLLVVAATASYWLAGTAERPPPLPSSVAVLPFENSSPDPADAYFASGIQDEIVSQLTKLSGLTVTPVRLGAGGQASIPEVIRGLNVATVLGGSVHSADGRWRVNTRLTSVATSVSLWSDSYEHERSDSFKIQRDIALDVAQALNIELTAAERLRIARAPTTDPEALELYLTAKGRIPRDAPEEVPRAISELEQALRLDEFAEALAALSDMRGINQFYDTENAAQHQALAEKAARRALVLDPDLGEAHVALGFVLWTKKDWIGAETAFRRAASLNQYASGAHATLQLSVGNFAVARDISEKVRAAEPYNHVAHRFLMHAYAGVGNWYAATALYESGKSLFDPWLEGSVQRMHWLVGRGELAEARTIPMLGALNATMLGSLDASGEALAELRRAYDASLPGNPNLRRDIGIWAGYFDDPELALEAMRAVIDEQGGQSVYLWYPQLAVMRRLPAFKAYLREIGMVEYWREYGWPPFCRPLDERDFDCH